MHSLRTIFFWVVLPIIAIMGGSAGIHHYVARSDAEAEATQQLTSSAQLLARLLDRHIDRLDDVLQTTLAQESLTNYLMFQQAGLLDEAENSRLEMEQTLIRLQDTDLGINNLEMFDSNGERFIAVTEGLRLLDKLNGTNQGWYRRTLKVGHSVEFGSDWSVRVSRTLPASEGPPLVATVVCEFGKAVGDACHFATRHLSGVRVRIVDRNQNIRFEHDDSPTGEFDSGAISVQAEMREESGVVHVEQSNRTALAAFGASQWLLLMALVAVTILLALMATLGTRLTTRELRQVQCVLAERVSELQDAQQTLEQQTATVEKQRDVLVISQQRAEAANQAKTQFLANMSHEIRTPLNGILGFTDVLIKYGDDVDPEERNGYLQTIQKSGRHLLSVINEILDLSKIESGAFEINRTDVGVWDLLTDVVDMVRTEAAEKRLQLNYTWNGPTPLSVSTDVMRVRQLFVNLVSNAIKFTLQGSVSIDAKIVQEHGDVQLVLEVTDTGIGIPADRIESIFEPFVQVDGSMTRQFGGTGLGLAISRRIARALGGDLSVESREGVGSRFTATIDVGPESSVVWQEEAKQTSDSEACPAVENEQPLSGRTILLVDDVPTNCKLASLYLRRAGAETTSASNGLEALEQVSLRNFDAILMDMQMPVMDGYTATSELRADGVRIPIIAVTAHAMKGDGQRCLDAGCSAWLSKPVEPASLMKTLVTQLSEVPQEADAPTTC